MLATPPPWRRVTPPPRPRVPPSRPGDEHGHSPVVAVVAVAAFLGFLLLATQTLLHLSALSTASAAAADAARRAAAADGSCASGLAHAHAVLGDWADALAVTCTRGADTTEVRVRGPSPARVVAAAAGALRLGEVDRAARVPTEGAAP